MNEGDFDYVRKLVLERSAIVLESGKGYLAESRLVPLAREAGMGSIDELVKRLRAERFGDLHVKVVEAMTTNETSFFRDLHPYDAMRTTIVPELMRKRASARALRIWSAASSSGQEPYSLAIMVREHFPALADWRVEIFATDLSSEMVRRAQAGLYSQIEVNRGLPIALVVKYFEKKGVQYELREDVRRMVEFRKMNLAEPWPRLPEVDVVFMRNVLIYFDVETKRAILERVRRVLRPDGCLFLGGAETTINLDTAFERVQVEKASCYRLRTSGET